MTNVDLHKSTSDFEFVKEKKTNFITITAHFLGAYRFPN